MGEAKKRGTREERIAQAQERSRGVKSAEVTHMVPFPKTEKEIKAIDDKLLSNLTTPRLVDEQVSDFCRKLSAKDPVFLDCHPESWSRQSCCEENVKHYIERHGGRMVCGYRIWYKEPIYIEGERHAVWTNGMELRDVSFVDTGETNVLFLPDDLMFDGAPAKVRHSFDDSYGLVIDRMNYIDSMSERLSPEDAWNLMPTYEQWLAGRRMPNMWAKLQPRRR